MSARTIPVAAVVMTRDEVANIEACLGHLERFGQVVVVDSDSRDGTVEKVVAAGVELVRFTWNGTYPKKKQWCLQMPCLRFNWVLLVDADERVPPALADEIEALFGPIGQPRRPAVAAYFVGSRPIVLGHRLRFGTPYRKVALMDRTRVAFPPLDDLTVRRMWEVEGHYQPQVAGSISRLRTPLIHDDRKEPFHWMERHNRYSDWEAHLRVTGQSRRTLGQEPPVRRWAKWAWSKAPARPLLAFVESYFLRLGFLDGLAGLHHAMGRAFYYWLIGYKVEWLRSRREPPQAAASSGTSPAKALTSSNARRRTGSWEIR